MTDYLISSSGDDDDLTILDLEIRELRIESQLLNDARVFARSKLGVILRFGACHNHLARSEYERGCLRIADTHDHGGETFRVVFSIASVQSDGLEI